MRLRPRRTPPPFLNPKDQRRMLALVGALGLTVIAVGWAADPANWHWIAPPADPAGHADARPGVRVAGDGVKLSGETARPRPGAFRAVAQTDADRAGPGEAAADDRPDPAALPPVLLADVRDNTLGLSLAERAAQARILDRLSRTDAAALAAIAEPVSFGALMADPEFYRGKPVTLTGEARGLWDRDDGLVEAWFFPPTAGNRPVRAIANAAPDLPRGQRLNEPVPVRVTGYFFKRLGYDAEGGLQIAPLVFADRIGLERSRSAVPPAPKSLPWAVLGVAAALAAGASVLLWRWRAGDAAFERGTLRRVTAAQAGELDLPDDDAADPAAFLAGLSAASDPPAGSSPAPSPEPSPADSEARP